MRLTNACEKVLSVKLNNITCLFQVEQELKDICNDILSVLDKHLIPCSDTGESKVFYYKMKGDYHRYLAEFATSNDRKEAAENSLVAYKAASDIAMTELPTTHPIRQRSIATNKEDEINYQSFNMMILFVTIN